MILFSLMLTLIITIRQLMPYAMMIIADTLLMADVIMIAIDSHMIRRGFLSFSAS
jgi:hypothetical protein